MRWNAAARRSRYGAAFAGKAVAHWAVICYNLNMRMGAKDAIRCRMTKVRRCDPHGAGQRTKKQEGTMSSKLVAYFSATGVTGEVAKTLAESIGADLFEIKAKTPYTQADLNWMDQNARSTIEMSDPASRPEMAEGLGNMDQYDTIFVGFPIWWYAAPTIINTFLESCDLTGKTVVPFATSGGSGMGKTNQRLAPSCEGARLLDGKVFKRGVGQKELAAWVDGLGL